jgi:hypothetical protein
VIFDSCHSGGISRTDMVARTVESTSVLPEDLDRAIWVRGLPQTPAIDIPTGFLDKTMSSHVLLAACRPNQIAFENSSVGDIVRGAFTRSLVKLLYEADLTQVTYSEVPALLPELPLQHPQCEGVNKARVLFNGAVHARQMTFKLYIEGGEYRADAGDIHGVVNGTLFAVHALGNVTSIDSETGILQADFVFTHTCTLRRRREDVEFDILAGARGSVLNWREAEKVLKVFMEPPSDQVQSIEHVFDLVDHSESADLVVRRTGGGILQFERLDPLMSKYARVLDKTCESNLSNILQGVSHFSFHLCRRNSANPLHQLVKVVMHRLTQSNLDEIWEEPVYIPDGHFDMPLVLDHPNTVFISSQPTTAVNSDRVFYGLTLQNYSGRKLFPYIMYFDPSDYSIQVMSLKSSGIACYVNFIFSRGTTRHQAQ